MERLSRPPNSVTGVVFSDVNGNGRQDPGEPDLPGYTVQLIGGSIVQTVQSGLGDPRQAQLGLRLLF